MTVIDNIIITLLCFGVMSFVLLLITLGLMRYYNNDPPKLEIEAPPLPMQATVLASNNIPS